MSNYHLLNFLNFSIKIIQKKKISFKGKKKNNLEKIFEHYNKKNLKKTIFYVENLALQNNYFNLISMSTIPFFYRKHFMDSMTLNIFFEFFLNKKKKNFCMEIGTGGGFPGLLLSLFFTRFFFVLTESIQKKSKFHSKIINVLKLKNSKALNSRTELIAKSINHRRCYTFIIVRAVSELHFLIILSFPLLNINGKILILKQTIQISDEIKNGIILLKKNRGKIKSILCISYLKKGRIILILKN
jgi:16S rRNA (guanine527-N7)-methyltransferase